MNSLIPELEAVFAGNKKHASINTHLFVNLLEGVYLQSIPWKSCVIVRATGFKLPDPWRHEGVLLTVEKDHVSFFVVLERDWEADKKEPSSSASAKSLKHPLPSPAASLDEPPVAASLDELPVSASLDELPVAASLDEPPVASSGDQPPSPPTRAPGDSPGNSSNEFKTNARVLFSKSAKACDRVNVYLSNPSKEEWLTTYDLNFKHQPGLPLMIGALVGDAITKSYSNYQLVTTNCYFFSGLYCEILKKYAEDEKITISGGKRSTKTAKTGTYLGLEIISHSDLMKCLQVTYPVFRTGLKEFLRKVRLDIVCRSLTLTRDYKEN